MSTQRPSVVTPTDDSGLPRTTLLVMTGGPDAQSAVAVAHRLAGETGHLLETLEDTIARLALAHRSCMPEAEDQAMDDEAFAWVQQSLEDIAATLRGLSLGRTTEQTAPVDAPLRAVTRMT